MTGHQEQRLPWTHALLVLLYPSSSHGIPCPRIDSYFAQVILYLADAGRAKFFPCRRRLIAGFFLEVAPEHLQLQGARIANVRGDIDIEAGKIWVGIEQFQKIPLAQYQTRGSFIFNTR